MTVMSLPNLSGQNASISDEIASLAMRNSDPSMLPDVSMTNTMSRFTNFFSSRFSLIKKNIDGVILYNILYYIYHVIHYILYYIIYHLLPIKLCCKSIIIIHLSFIDPTVSFSISAFLGYVHACVKLQLKIIFTLLFHISICITVRVFASEFIPILVAYNNFLSQKFGNRIMTDV